MTLAVALTGHWMISNIPGSYEDFVKSENPEDASNYSDLQKTNKLFYFSFLPQFSNEEKLKPEELSWYQLLPHCKWNGTTNVFHQWLTKSSYSLRDSRLVREKVWEAIQWTLIVQLPALVLIFIVGVLLAEWSIRTQNKKMNSFVSKILTIFHSLPLFWLSSLLLVVFSSQGFLPILPSTMISADSNVPISYWFSNIHFIILPVVSITLPSIAVVYNLYRNSLYENKQKPLWGRAIGSGMSHQEVYKNELRPLAVIPLLGWMASAVPVLISGSIIIENIFSIPGTGRLLFQSIGYRDWPVVHGLIMVASILTMLGILLADWVQRLIDPKTKD